MRKTWTAPTLGDFNIASRKRGKPDCDVGDCISLPEPKSVDELTVHPKKVEEVRRWVSRCTGEKSSLLLISGPPGSGKTVTLKLVAEAEGLSLMEWISPVSKALGANILDEQASERNAFFDTSEGKKFEDFMIRSGRYPSLFQSAKPTLILVKDIPNAFIWKPETFHSFLQKYKSIGKFPIVFIVTDTENFDLHSSLFPNDLKLRFGISVIKFNPVSDTFLKKNLKNLSCKLKTNALPPEYLEKIVKNAAGDLRSATTDVMVQFRMGDLGTNQSNKKRKLRPKTCDDKKKEEMNVGPLPSRDHGYDFYKKMGRILYPKRTAEEGEGSGDLVYNLLEISENWCKSYQSFLHENYLQTFSKLQDATSAADCFSFCDILGRHKEVENCSSIVMVAGLMTANTQPKKNGFLPFKKSINLYSISNWKCIFNESSVLKHGVQERVFSLDVAPLKTWLPVDDSSVRTLGTGKRENCINPTVSQRESVKMERNSRSVNIDVCNNNNDNDNDNEDEDEDDGDDDEEVEIEEVED